MSLDVCLTAEVVIRSESSGIFVRQHGALEEISRQEWDEMCPGHTPTLVKQVSDTRCVYDANITHNLNTMAEAAGIYMHLWRPEEIGIIKAVELIEPLRAGLKRLKADPVGFRRYEPSNGWGLYKHFVPFVENYLDACVAYPDATVSVSR